VLTQTAHLMGNDVHDNFLITRLHFAERWRRRRRTSRRRTALRCTRRPGCCCSSHCSMTTLSTSICAAGRGRWRHRMSERWNALQFRQDQWAGH